MREEPGERVFDIPANTAPAHPAAPKTPPAQSAPPHRQTAAVPAAPKPQATAAPVTGSGNWWRSLAENCKGQLPPMYRAFLDLCRGTVASGIVQVYAPDDITKGRLDNDRVRSALGEEASKAAGMPVRLTFRVGEPPKATPRENLQNLLKFGSQFDNIQIK